MYAGEWDYKNESQIPNMVAYALEKIDLASVTNDQERFWVRDILWLWNHHAITCALHRYGDVKAAREFSEKALALMPPNHPNMITKLLHLLVHERGEEARAYASSIVSEVERDTATVLLREYENGTLFKVRTGKRVVCKKHMDKTTFTTI